MAELRVYTNQDSFDVQAHALQPFLRSFEKTFGRPLDIQWFPGSRQASLFKRRSPICPGKAKAPDKKSGAFYTRHIYTKKLLLKGEASFCLVGLLWLEHKTSSM